MFNKNLFFGILACLILFGCNGAGSGTTNNLPDGGKGATVFNESSLIMKVGDIKNVTLLLPRYPSSLEGHTVDFWASESGIVNFPSTCQLNNLVPPSCNLEIMALEAGTTSIQGFANTGSAIPIDITVINQ